MFGRAVLIPDRPELGGRPVCLEPGGPLAARAGVAVADVGFGVPRFADLAADCARLGFTAAAACCELVGRPFALAEFLAFVFRFAAIDLLSGTELGPRGLNATWVASDGRSRPPLGECPEPFSAQS